MSCVLRTPGGRQARKGKRNYDLLESRCLHLDMVYLLPALLRSWSRLHEHGVAHQQMHHSACPANTKTRNHDTRLPSTEPAAKADKSEALRPAMAGHLALLTGSAELTLETDKTRSWGSFRTAHWRHLAVQEGLETLGRVQLYFTRWLHMCAQQPLCSSAEAQFLFGQLAANG